MRLNNESKIVTVLILNMDSALEQKYKVSLDLLKLKTSIEADYFKKFNEEESKIIDKETSIETNEGLYKNVFNNVKIGNNEDYSDEEIPEEIKVGDYPFKLHIENDLFFKGLRFDASINLKTKDSRYKKNNDIG